MSFLFHLFYQAKLLQANGIELIVVVDNASDLLHQTDIVCRRDQAIGNALGIQAAQSDGRSHFDHAAAVNVRDPAEKRKGFVLT